MSKLETRFLGYAITNKLNEIRQLTLQIRTNDLDRTPMSERDKRVLMKHYQKKIQFYQQQDLEKWTNWPRKTKDILLALSPGRSERNYKKRDNQRARQVEKTARKALEEGSVVILVDVGESVPLGAIAVLNKGLGFVPTPKTNTEESRLDMRLTVNRILKSSTRSLNTSPCSSVEDLTQLDSEEPVPKTTPLPSKLSRKYYGKGVPTEDQTVNDIVDSMASEYDQKLLTNKDNTTKRQKKNLNREEQRGLKWLERMVENGKIGIVAADKGGAVLLVDPTMLKKKTLEKLNNPTLYKRLDKDPTPDLHKQLFDLWVDGKKKEFVTPDDAQRVMGITHNLKQDGTYTNNPSTLPHFKPGRAYFYPSLKIHKLKKEDLKPGVEPPIRLITALQDGITKRSDVFLASRYLKDLEKDFCKDLLTDTTDALRWLENINANQDKAQKKKYCSFTYDFKALYDSLTPSIVMEALYNAMRTCREEWSEEFCEWLLSLVELSLQSSCGVYDGNWFIQLLGIATGGSLCVQIANIAVYYILHMAVYSNSDLMKLIIDMKRFIDDGVGLCEGTPEEFSEWMSKVNDALKPYGLLIDEHQAQPTGAYVSFLDIKFTFDDNGDLQTDLFIKETDSRSYLHFTSAHPNHIYSGIVYSQCIRLRRIINSQERLKHQLDILKKSFFAAGYPHHMVENISKKVLSSERSLARKADHIAPDQTSTFLPIRVVSTFGSDNDLVATTKKYEEHLQRTRSFSESDTTITPESTPSGQQSRSKRLFQFVKKTAPSLRARLVKTKQLALGSTYGPTRKCNKANCACCHCIPGALEFTVNGKVVKSAPGTCESYNVIYLIQCSHCDKAYVGRTTRLLRKRIGEHRTKFYELLKGKVSTALQLDNDDFSLGVHLVDHGFNNKKDFNKIFKVSIIDNASPRTLEVRENKFIHILKTIRPLGINTVNPFGLPLLHLD